MSCDMCYIADPQGALLYMYMILGIIGASQSEPHTSEFEWGVCLFASYVPVFVLNNLYFQNYFKARTAMQHRI